MIERVSVPAAQLIHGEQVGGLPSQQEKITTKIEELAGVVLQIGLTHVERVFALFTCGIVVGLIVLLYEIIRGKFDTVKNNQEPMLTIEQRYRRSRSGVRRRRILVKQASV